MTVIVSDYAHRGRGPERRLTGGATGALLLGMSVLAHRLSFDERVDAPSLEVLELDGYERIGEPYRFTLVVRTKAAASQGSCDAWLGERVSLELAWSAQGGARDRRTLRAVVDAVEDAMEVLADGSRTFTLVLRPRFAGLDRFVTQDIFSGASIPAVIRTKLEIAQIPDSGYALRLADEAVYLQHDGAPGDLAQGRLVVQYKESDLAFVSRLAEQAGLSYFFEEGDDDDRVVFTDYDGGFARRESTLPFGGDGERPGVASLKRRLSSTKSQFFAYDYNYRTPHLDFQRNGELLFDVLGGEASLDVPTDGALLEYAPNVKTPAEAAWLARVRAEEEEARRERFSMRCLDPTVFAGQRVRVSGHPELDEETELLVVAVRHRYVAPSHAQGEVARAHHHAELDAVRTGKQGADGRPLQFRSERRTPRPRISGVVTGIVQSVAPDQAEGRQHIDAEGRYLVKLHFDQGMKTMPRVRMAQPSAGGGYGQHFPLRPGAEVVVAFLDGDPDRPVILGAVPNPTQRSPVTVPNEREPPEVNRIKTISGVVFEIGDGLRRDT